MGALTRDGLVEAGELVLVGTDMGIGEPRHERGTALGPKGELVYEATGEKGFSALSGRLCMCVFIRRARALFPPEGFAVFRRRLHTASSDGFFRWGLLPRTPTRAIAGHQASAISKA